MDSEMQVVQLIFPLCPFLPMVHVHWEVVQFGLIPLSLPSHGTLGWEGQWDEGMGVVEFGMFRDRAGYSHFDLRDMSSLS